MSSHFRSIFGRILNIHFFAFDVMNQDNRGEELGMLKITGKIKLYKQNSSNIKKK